MQHDGANRTNTRRRMLVAGALGAGAAWSLLGCGGGGGGDGGSAQTVAVPLGSWMAAPSNLREDVRFLDIPPPAITMFREQTLRQTVRLSLGGERVRIQFSNLYGQTPLSLARVRAALGKGDGAVDVATDVAVTFQGAQAVRIAPGAQVWSDPIAIRVADAGLLSVSVYVQDAADCTTAHRYARAVHYLAPGDQTRAAAVPTAAANQLSSTYWMSAIDVYRQQSGAVVAAFGDSLTDGNGSTDGTDRRYPDLLAARFLAAGRAVSVVNAGLAGNRWLHDRFGQRGTERFRRDALGVTGVTHVIIQMGINDIGFQQAWTPDEKASANDLIAALAAAASAAKAAGAKAYLTTLTPCQGHVFFSAPGEQMRQTVNAWIRANTDVAGVFDFDAVVRDPEEPARILPAYRADDQLHLNDQGYARLAQSIALDALR